MKWFGAGTFQLSVKSWSIVGQLKGLGVEMISRLAYIDPHNIYVDMPKQNDQKCNKCRQKRQHAEKDTIYCGFRAFGWNLGFLLELPKGDHPKQGSWTDQVWGRPQGRPNQCTFTHWDLKIDSQKLFWTRQILWKKNCLGVSAGSGDWIRGTKYRHRDSSDSWPPTLNAIYRAFRPLTTRWPLKFLNEFDVHFKFCNHDASIGKFLSALVVHFDTVFI